MGSAGSWKHKENFSEGYQFHYYFIFLMECKKKTTQTFPNLPEEIIFYIAVKAKK